MMIYIHTVPIALVLLLVAMKTRQGRGQVARKPRKTRSRMASAAVTRLSTRRRRSSKSAEESTYRQQLRIASQFSPIGKFPPDFGEWATLQSVSFEEGEKDEEKEDDEQGVFTTRKIPKYMYLAEYRGERFYAPAERGFRQGDYGAYIIRIFREGKLPLFINAYKKEKSSWARYINTNKIDPSKNNAMFVSHEEGGVTRVYVVTIKNIEKGEEICIDYKLYGEK